MAGIMDLRNASVIAGAFWLLSCSSRRTTADNGGSVSGSTSSTTGGATTGGSGAPDGPAHCSSGPGVSVLYDAGPEYISGMVAVGEQLIVTTSREVLRIPLPAGPPTTIAQPDSPAGLLVVGSDAYFAARHASSTTTSLYAVPLAGGETRPV